MSSLGTFLAAGAALGVASEATGTTDFTPLGQQAGDRQGAGGGPAIDLDLGGAAGQAAGAGMNADVLEQLATAFQQQQSGPGALEVMQAMQQQENPALEQLRAAYEDQRRRAEEWREEARRRTEDADVNGDGGNVPDWVQNGEKPPWMPEPDIEDPTEGDDPNGDGGDGFDLQDLEGRGPGGVGTIVAATGEAGAAAGDAVEESVGGLTRVGNTYAQAARAAAGKEYSAEDTLAESIHGTETRRINWDDYKPSLPDAPDVPDLDLGSDSSDEPPEGPTLAEMTPGAEHLPGVETPDRSNDSPTPSSSSSDDLGARTEEAIEKLKEGRVDQIGGL